MNHDDLERRLAELVQAAHDSGMSDEGIIDVLMDAVEALREGLTQSQ